MDADGRRGRPSARPRQLAPALTERSTSAVAAYASTFAARHAGWGEPVLGVPGLHGAVSSDPPTARVLVTDDRAVDGLVRLLPTLRASRITVLADAARCAELVAGTPGWRSSATTAMVRDDLSTVPDVPLPDGLALRPVHGRAGDVTGGVLLEDAVAVAVSADPTSGESAAVLAGSLRSMMPAFRLLAAVDGDGVVRGTSGVGVFGSRAVVIFVDTDPGWRRRGVGRAMTAAALHLARADGASVACLDASDVGLSVYERLGFEVVARSARFSGPG